MTSRRIGEISALALTVALFGGGAVAQEALPDIDVAAPIAAATPGAAATRSDDAQKARVRVEAASETVFSGQQVNAVPFARPGEALEIVPGLSVTQHSGEGKANQYFLRGFQLDHGTDFSLTLDGMPINMRTHGHGQGYADANFLIPELLSSVVGRKGPYYADKGDFSSAGAVDMQYIDKLDRGFFRATGGSFAYGRLLGAKSFEVNGGNLLTAIESSIYNGPWTRPDEMRKINSVLRWSRGTQEDGLSITAMAYANRWFSTDQIPSRAVYGGVLPLWGNLDSTDGGDASRFSLSARWSQTEGPHSSRVEAYAIRSTLDLYNNFTYFLSHPDIGDQFRQFDRRTVLGVNAQHAYKYEIAGLPIESRIGLESRYDNIRIGLQDSWRRQPYDAIVNSHVAEGSVGLWTDTTVRFTPWLRATGGVRFDYFAASVGSLQDPLSAPKDGNGAPIWTGPWNSGSKSATMGSPKVGIVVGPFEQTELFLNFGEGLHSTDVRGTVTRLSPADGSSVATIPLLVKQRGAEIGLRTTRLLEGLESSVALWWLNNDSENQFEGDSGSTAFGRPSRRYGVEIINHYTPTSWLRMEGSVSLSHARFRGVDQQQALAWIDLLSPDAIGYGTFVGNAPGNFIPDSPNIVAMGQIEVGEATGPFAALRYRYLGERPLTADGAFKSPATGTLNLRAGYRFDNGWSIQADAFNVTNSRSDMITYGYGSLIPSDPLYGLCKAGVAPGNVCSVGVMGRHFKPMEPPAVRVSITGPLPF
ncbi:TonB-dependent receptor [Methylosinus sp. H3A]|uniref:TonB-dependent receptor n=1 Tax=Methylosinus sp. H3A TaxID=2785786 RepID=UPI0018C29ADF|nr:TonB-dependent receptor [Methylosinus sp. H3A]MBG0810144.1 TonB-dependent receptor [Methylosinus sp. H3A]